MTAPGGGGADEIREQLAAVLAEKFTSEHGARNPDWDWEQQDGPDNPYHLPVAMADRVQRSPHVIVTADDGCPSFTLPSCADLADALLPTVQALIAAAEERGRQSVGLGDFLPGGCDEEVRAPNYHFTETYGDWLECTRRKGHDGDHEHEDSGFTWPRADALDGTP